MQPLIVLLATFLVLSVVPLFRKRFPIGRRGIISLGIMLLFTAIGHFKYIEGMSLMIPAFLPFPKLITIVTGIFEIIAGILLVAGRFTKIIVWLVLVFFVLILPANINASINHVNIQEADFTGSGPEYLWFRIPLQLLFIAWTYFFYRKTNDESDEKSKSVEI